jgi:hypothetical protein
MKISHRLWCAGRIVGRCTFAGNASAVHDNEELIAQNLGVFHAP